MNIRLYLKQRYEHLHMLILIIANFQLFYPLVRVPKLLFKHPINLTAVHVESVRQSTVRTVDLVSAPPISQALIR